MSARSSSFPRTAVVTGAAGGIGRALVGRLQDGGAEVVALDLVDGFDVTDPKAWESVERAELACLNAGMATSTASLTDLTVEEYRRVVAVNVDGVVLGLRRLARVMRDGDAIVVTASLAGLVGLEGDPVYALTKHALVGLVRSAARQLAERGIRLNAVCPGFADTPMVGGELRESLEAVGFPLLTAEDVADAILVAARSEATGEAWVVQPGRGPEPYRFRGIPGPRVDGERGIAPPPEIK
ncbi:MAG TPA: SDR family oxidoreductase [Gaiellaceae bacterium]|nr:SDR family oxidoreductase [Gaiellaceae bacterium]